MTQTRLESLIESITNIVLGYSIAILSQLIIFPCVGIDIPLKTNFVIGFWFTLISLIRSYCIRRWFNVGLHRVIHQAAARLYNRKDENV